MLDQLGLSPYSPINVVTPVLSFASGNGDATFSGTTYYTVLSGGMCFWVMDVSLNKGTTASGLLRIETSIPFRSLATTPVIVNTSNACLSLTANNRIISFLESASSRIDFYESNITTGANATLTAAKMTSTSMTGRFSGIFPVGG